MYLLFFGFITKYDNESQCFLCSAYWYYLFQVAAAFVIYVGIAYIFANYGSFAQVIGKPAIILVCAAGVLVLAGMIGCFGAFCEKKSCLGLVSVLFCFCSCNKSSVFLTAWLLFFIFQFLMFLVTVAIVQASVGGILLTYRATSKQSYDSYVWDQFTQYGNDTCGSSVANSTFNATDFIDKVQQKVRMWSADDVFSLESGGSFALIQMNFTVLLCLSVVLFNSCLLELKLMDVL